LTLTLSQDGWSSHGCGLATAARYRLPAGLRLWQGAEVAGASYRNATEYPDLKQINESGKLNREA